VARNQFSLNRIYLKPAIIALLFILLLFACSSPIQTSLNPTISPSNPRATPSAVDQRESEPLSQDQVATLSSLKKIDDFPLYTMHYFGPYDQNLISSQGIMNTGRVGSQIWNRNDAWVCSLFTSFGDPQNMLYGRNFDWEYSPAVLLFTHPPDKHASVSMVDIAYLGFTVDQYASLLDLSLEQREPLLQAPFWPFDGMNEKGLTVGMAAVPPGEMIPDPNNKTIGSLEIMREILDKTENVDQAIDVFNNYNIDFSGGPPIHYLVADSSGRGILVEFFQGQSRLIPNDSNWHLATNYLRSAVEKPEGQCSRYDKILDQMTRVDGRLSAQGGLILLADISQNNTQWSILYHMSSGQIDVVPGRQFDHPYTFYLNP
jgi:hypothetical protein